jgi:hypothetical protein
MKYGKLVGLLAMAAAALMAFSASASAATTLTSPANTVLGAKAKITGKSIEGAIAGTKHVVLTGPLGINVQCESHVEGEVTGQNAGGTTEGKITSLAFTGCTNGYIVHVKALGTLEVHTEKTTANGNGTITASGTTVEVTNTPVGTCAYQTGSNLDIGQLTGSDTDPLFEITAAIPRHAGSGGAFCGSSGTWEGKYTVTVPSSTSPNVLTVH